MARVMTGASLGGEQALVSSRKRRGLISGIESAPDTSAGATAQGQQ